MKQVFNKKGEIVVSEVPAPIAGDNEILIHVYLQELRYLF